MTYDLVIDNFVVQFSMCLGGEIGRHTGLKILGYGQTGVPVRFRPEAPLRQVFELKCPQNCKVRFQVDNLKSDRKLRIGT